MPKRIGSTWTAFSPLVGWSPPCADTHTLAHIIMATNNWYGGAHRAGIGAGASGRRLRGGNSGARGSQRQQQLGCRLGRQIEADYYFVRRIGGGSFGDVYLAEERANRSHKVRVVCRAAAAALPHV